MTDDQRRRHFTVVGGGVRIFLPYDDLFGDGPRALLIAPGGTLDGHRAVAIALAARSRPNVTEPEFIDPPRPGEVIREWERALRLAHDDVAAYEESKREWIGRAASQHLRLGFARGYSMQDVYLSERVAIELSGFDALVDPGVAVGHIADCPSPDAIKLLTLVEAELDVKGASYDRAEVVALVRGPSWRSRRHVGQAVVVRSWLGRHDVWIPA